MILEECGKGKVKWMLPRWQGKKKSWRSKTAKFLWFQVKLTVAKYTTAQTSHTMQKREISSVKLVIVGIYSTALKRTTGLSLPLVMVSAIPQTLVLGERERQVKKHYPSYLTALHSGLCFKGNFFLRWAHCAKTSVPGSPKTAKKYQQLLKSEKGEETCVKVVDTVWPPVDRAHRSSLPPLNSCSPLSSLAALRPHCPVQSLRKSDADCCQKIFIWRSQDLLCSFERWNTSIFLHFDILWHDTLVIVSL